MSLLDSLKQLFTNDEVHPVHHASGPAAFVLEALSRVIDPELGIDIVSLGLIRSIEVEPGELDEQLAHVDMVFTTAGCPVAGMLIAEIEESLRAHGFTPVVTVLDGPSWEPEHMSPRAHDQLAARG